MRPVFTLHAGEYLVGNELEKKFKKLEVWVPSKDTGTDLLISSKRKNSLGIQVKFSKDFLPGMSADYNEKLIACGWWTFNADKIKNSNADLWFLTPYSFARKKILFIIISPKDLLRKLEQIHKPSKRIDTYLWITKDGNCFEARGLSKNEQENILNTQYSKISENRNFTKFLNNWEPIKQIEK